MYIGARDEYNRASKLAKKIRDQRRKQKINARETEAYKKASKLQKEIAIKIYKDKYSDRAIKMRDVYSDRPKDKVVRTEKRSSGGIVYDYKVYASGRTERVADQKNYQKYIQKEDAKQQTQRKEQTQTLRQAPPVSNQNRILYAKKEAILKGEQVSRAVPLYQSFAQKPVSQAPKREIKTGVGIGGVTANVGDAFLGSRGFSRTTVQRQIEQRQAREKVMQEAQAKPANQLTPGATETRTVSRRRLGPGGFKKITEETKVLKRGLYGSLVDVGRQKNYWDILWDW